MRSEGEKPPIGRSPRNRSLEMPRWKRAVDLSCGLAAMPFLALCTLVVAGVTRITSPGPVLFRQERIGWRGRRFMAYRFRTMHVGSSGRIPGARSGDQIRPDASMRRRNARDGAWFIPGGRLMRASRLDGLPLIINVLRGEMSVVGPRSRVPAEHQRLQRERREQSQAVPGLTGLWQVRGGTQMSREKIVRLDTFYVRKKSFWLELKIILLTVPALLRQIGERRDADKSSTRSGTSARVGA